MVRCYSCRTKWQDCQLRRSKSATRELSLKAQKTQKTQAEQQGGPKKRTALSPFGAREEQGKTPWVTTTPQTRVQTKTQLPDEEKQNKEAASSATPAITGDTSYTEAQIKDQLAVLIKNAGSTLNQGMREALEKLTTQTSTPEEPEGIRHAHVFKVENTRKALVKIKEKIMDADREWKSFESILMKKYESQKLAFLATRQDLVNAYKTKLEQYNLAVEEVKVKAAAEKTQAAGTVENIDIEPPPWSAGTTVLPTFPDMIDIDDPHEEATTRTPPQKLRRSSRRERSTTRKVMRETTRHERSEQPQQRMEDPDAPIFKACNRGFDVYQSPFLVDSRRDKVFSRMTLTRSLRIFAWDGHKTDGRDVLSNSSAVCLARIVQNEVGPALLLKATFEDLLPRDLSLSSSPFPRRDVFAAWSEQTKGMANGTAWEHGELQAYWICGMVIFGISKDLTYWMMQKNVVILMCGIAVAAIFLAIYELITLLQNRPRARYEPWNGIVQGRRCTGRRWKRTTSLRLTQAMILCMVVSAECIGDQKVSRQSNKEWAENAGMHEAQTDDQEDVSRAEIPATMTDRERYNNSEGLDRELQDESFLMQNRQQGWTRWYGPDALQPLDGKVVMARVWRVTGRRNKYMNTQHKWQSVRIERNGEYWEQLYQVPEIAEMLGHEFDMITVDCQRDIFDHSHHRVEILAADSGHEFGWTFIPVLGDVHGINFRFRAAAMIPNPEREITVQLMFDIFHEWHDCEGQQKCTALIGDEEYTYHEEVSSIPGNYIKLVMAIRDNEYETEGSSVCSTKTYEGSDSDNDDKETISLEGQQEENEREEQRTNDDAREHDTQHQDGADFSSMLQNVVGYHRDMDSSVLTRSHWLSHGKKENQRVLTRSPQNGSRQQKTDLENKQGVRVLTRSPSMLTPTLHENSNCQPSPIVYEGQDVVTLIMDVQPMIRTVPFIIVTRFDQQHYRDTYDVASYRFGVLINCEQMKALTGLSMVCEHNAHCVCTHDNNRIDETHMVPIRGGDMLMIIIYFDQCRDDVNTVDQKWMDELQWQREEENEDANLMQMQTDVRTCTPFEMPWLYGFGIRVQEPIRAWRYGTSGTPSIPYLAKLYSSQVGTVLHQHVVGHRVVPQPRDITRLQAEAFVLAPREEVLPWKRLILLDTNWEYQDHPEVGTSIWKTEQIRQVRIVDHLLTKDAFIWQVGMSPFCEQPNRVCTTVLRGRPWMEGDDQRRIEDGDHAEITIRPRPMSRAPQIQRHDRQEECDRSVSPERTREQESRPSIETERSETSASSERRENDTITENDESMMMHLKEHFSTAENLKVNIIVYPHRLPEPVSLRETLDFRKINEKIQLQMRNFAALREGGEIVLAEIKPQPEDLHENDMHGYVTALRADVPIWKEVILLDVIFDSESTKSTRTPQSEKDLRRTVRIIDYHIELNTFYEQIGLGALCGRDKEACKTTIRGRHWNHEERMMRIHTGDYAVVTIQGSNEDIPVSLRLRTSQGGCTFEGMHEYQHLPQSTDEQDRTKTTSGQEKENDTRGEKRKGRSPQSEKTIEYNDDKDEQSLMQIIDTGQWYFLYQKGTGDPLGEHLRRHEMLDPALSLRTLYNQRFPRQDTEELQLFRLEPQPADLVRIQTIGMVLHREGEVERGSVMIMLDVEVYGSTRMRRPGTPSASDEWREVTTVRSRSTSGTFLQQVGLEAFCLRREAVCLLLHRGHLWNTQDTIAREIRNGDYLVVKIRNDDESTPFSSRWRQVQGECDQSERTNMMDEEESEGTTQTTNNTFEASGRTQEERPRGQEQERTMRRPSSSSITQRPNEEEDENQEGLALIQKSATGRRSFAWHAHERLPPPGNGTIRFCDQVESLEKEKEVWTDHRISNGYALELMEDFKKMEGQILSSSPFLRKCVIKLLETTNKKSN